jgi:hypothetical protein
MTGYYLFSSLRETRFKRLTNTTDPRLLTDDHTLQYPRTLEMFKILGDIRNPPIFECILPKYRIKLGKGMSDLIDRSRWWDK